MFSSYSLNLWKMSGVLAKLYRFFTVSRTPMSHLRCKTCPSDLLRWQTNSLKYLELYNMWDKVLKVEFKVKISYIHVTKSMLVFCVPQHSPCCPAPHLSSLITKVLSVFYIKKLAGFRLQNSGNNP